MARSSRDDDIDRLYQLPPGDFTRERNALAKHVGGEEGKRIKALTKPSASAWAVNQFYWRDRAPYDALIKAAEHLRAAHRAVLGGGNADLRRADAAHRDAVNAALSSTLRIAKDAGQGVSSAMQMEIARTLQSLPGDAARGRLTKALRPGGFEALQGMPLRERKAEPAPAAEKPPPRPDRRTAERERAEARRALNEARQNERRARAAVARLQKELTHSERRTATAKAAWERAQREEDSVRNRLQEAERILERDVKALHDLE
jgi:hypothetical protein